MQEDRIYLDFNATTPFATEVAAAMNQVLTKPFGKPRALGRAAGAAGCRKGTGTSGGITVLQPGQGRLHQRRK